MLTLAFVKPPLSISRSLALCHSLSIPLSVPLSLSRISIYRSPCQSITLGCCLSLSQKHFLETSHLQASDSLLAFGFRV
jgi:hypothetical protein